MSKSCSILNLVYVSYKKWDSFCLNLSIALRVWTVKDTIFENPPEYILINQLITTVSSHCEIKYDYIIYCILQKSQVSII